MKTGSKVSIAIGIVVVFSYGALLLDNTPTRSHYVGKDSCEVVGIEEALEDDGTVKSVISQRCSGRRRIIRTAVPNARAFAVKQGAESECDKWVSFGRIFGRSRPGKETWKNCSPKADAS